LDEKYHWSINEDVYPKQVAGWRYLDLIGFLVKNGLVDSEKIYEIQGHSCITIWDKSKEIIKGYGNIVRFLISNSISIICTTK